VARKKLNVKKKGSIHKDIPKTKARAYQSWINKNVPDRCLGKCRPRAHAMVRKFPELQVVGYAYDSNTQHVYCVDSEGRHVDPTFHQFIYEGGMFFGYPEEPLEPKDFPTGRCWICGELQFPDTPGAHKFCEGTGQEAGPHKYCEAEMRKEYADV